MIDLRAARPTLVESADGGGLAEMREGEEGQDSDQSLHSLSHTGSHIHTIHRPLRDIFHRAEVNYSKVKLDFAQDGYF